MARLTVSEQGGGDLGFQIQESPTRQQLARPQRRDRPRSAAGWDLRGPESRGSEGGISEGDFVPLVLGHLLPPASAGYV